MRIVLFEPEIPQNTGNISRTCAAVGIDLYLVGKMGFSIEEKWVRRAGLDYWDKVNICRYREPEMLDTLLAEGDFYLASTHGGVNYADVSYSENATLVFGRESAGLPHELLQKYPDRVIRIPMRPDIRSLNLSNAVAIVAFEALRQQGFPGLTPRQGEREGLNFETP